jgi:putative ABC transport system permease protein
VASAHREPRIAHAVHIVREALAAAVAAPVASLIVVIMVAGMCAAVVLTSGRTVGAQEAVLGSIDSAGTRSIVIRAEAAAGLDSSVLDRIENVDGIEWAGAFGPAMDARNAAFEGGLRIPLRLAYGSNWTELDLPEPLRADGDIAYASNLALAQLGMTDRVGSVVTLDGNGYAIAGHVAVPDGLSFLEPVFIAPQPITAIAPISILIVTADRPDLVAPVADAVTSILAAEDPTQITVETSEDLASLRALIEGQLGLFGRGLTIGILALNGVLSAAIMYGLITLRRKDFGRRRALGASQPLIIALLLTQTGLLATTGAALGTSAALITLHLTGDPLPGATYALGIGVLAVAVAVVATIVPAIAASRRQPITELRVP